MVKAQPAQDRPPRQKFRTIQIMPTTKTVIEAVAIITGKTEYALIDELVMKEYGDNPAVIAVLKERFGTVPVAPAQTKKGTTR